MAKTIISPVKLDLNEPGQFTFTAPSDASDGFSVDYKEQDNRLVLLLRNEAAAAATATVKAGDGIQGIVDYVYDLPASSSVALRLEAGKFKRVTGDDRGNVLIVPSATTVLAALVLLP
jgi:hypothetical protein